MKTSKEVAEMSDMLDLVAQDMQEQLDVLRTARSEGRYKRATQAVYRIQVALNDLRELSKYHRK
jgi:hypothetical protein